MSKQMRICRSRIDYVFCIIIQHSLNGSKTSENFDDIIINFDAR